MGSEPVKRRGWSNGDPTGSEKPRGKARSARKGRYDGGFTPSEQRKKDQLMRQFLKGYDGPRGASLEYVNAPCWCEYPGCSRLKSGYEKYCASHGLSEALRPMREKMEKEMGDSAARWMKAFA